MMMGIDQPRQHDMAFEIEHFISSRRKIAHLADLLNEATANKKTTLGNFPLMVIHGDNVGVLDQKSGHGLGIRCCHLYSCLTS